MDPVTQEILGNALFAISEEMAVVEYRSSFSPIIREMLDFCCGLFDHEGRMIAHSEQIPAQLGLMQFALAAALSEHGTLHPGDVVLTNNPYLGGTHTNDLQVFAPIHVDGRLMGYAGSIAHHIDVGGTFPGTESPLTTEIYQEGVIFPAIKYVDRGVRNEAVAALIAANVRDPHSTMGDLSAQLAACRRGIERVQELCARNGTDTVAEAIQLLLIDTQARAAALFASWPDAASSATGWMDGLDGTEPIKIVVTVHASGGRLSVDFTGTSPQVPTGLNVPIASTHAGVYFAVRCFAGDSGVRQNDGLTRLIDVCAAPGSLVNPDHPAPLSARHLAVQRIADLMVTALGQLMPDRDVAGSHVSFPAWTLRAHDARWGKATILADILGGGGGARRDAAGDNAIDTYTSNCAILPAEIAEQEYPWRIERTELVDGSGGAGVHAGGLGLRRDLTLLVDVADGPYYLEQTHPDFVAAGRDGGSPGSPARVRLRRTGETEFSDLPCKGQVRLRRGDTISFQSSGGGGYGSPGTQD